MADEPTRTTSEALSTTERARPVPGAMPPAPAPAARGNGRPSEPAELRREIERTRLRMSHTLDAIEERLVEEKKELWARITLRAFRRKISTEPWRSVAIAFAAGYVIAAIRD